MPTVTQPVSSKAKTGKQWLSASSFQFFITPPHVEGPDPPGSHPQGLRTAPGWGRGWQQDGARRSRAGASFCLNARPASYWRGRGTTPVDSDARATQKGEFFRNKEELCPAAVSHCLQLHLYPHKLLARYAADEKL